MLKPENRVKLLLSGMENIDRLQQKTIAQAKRNIKDFEAFHKSTHLQFEKSMKEYKRVLAPIEKQIKQQHQFKPDTSTKKMIDNTVNSQKEIIDYLKKHKDEFEKKYNISKLALFGSYSRGENRKESDIDIAIETELSDYFLLYDFKEELEKHFRTKVDVVRIRDRMNTSLQRRIMKDGIYV